MTPERLLLGPGPSPVPPRVLNAMAAPVLSHLDPDMMAILGDIRAQLTWIFGAADPCPARGAGPRTAAAATRAAVDRERCSGSCGHRRSRCAPRPPHGVLDRDWRRSRAAGRAHLARWPDGCGFDDRERHAVRHGTRARPTHARAHHCTIRRGSCCRGSGGALSGLV